MEGTLHVDFGATWTTFSWFTMYDCNTPRCKKESQKKLILLKYK